VSDINFISINENFPIPGQDNDTQVFRDNFDAIKKGLRTASDEITDIQDNGARKDEENDFFKNELKNLVLSKASVKIQNYGSPITNSEQEINFIQGLHHILRVGNDLNLKFVGFPGDTTISVADLLTGMGKITLEIYGDGIARTLSFNQSSGTIVKICDFPATPLTVQSGSDPILLEVWRYNSNIIFIKYLGQFV
jgi:hypothetical protein